MKKITFLLLTILPLIGFGQTTIASYTFDADVQGWVVGNAADTSVDYDASNYYTASGSLKMGQLTVNKVIKVTGISITDLGDYTLKFKIKGVNTANVKGIIRTDTNYQGTPLLMSGLTSSTGGDSDTWYEYSTTITLPVASANSQIQIQTNTLGTYYIDDVVLIQEPLSGNALTVNIVGGGSVVKNPDQISYDPSDVVELTATPTTHWDFDSWSGDLVGTYNPGLVTMDTDKTVTANFSVDPAFDYAFTFDTDNDLEGWSTDPNLVVSNHTGGFVTFSITPDQWNRFNLQGFPIPSTSYNKVTITLRNISANDELGFIVDDGSPELMIEYPISINDTEFKTYNFDLTQNTKWTGDVTYVRLRFADADNVANPGKPNAAGIIIVDDIVFSFDPNLSSNDYDVLSFSLYPNPTKNILNINSKTEISKVQVYDITGKQVLETTKPYNNQINVSSLKTGLYVLRIEDVNNNKAVKKLVVQ